MDTMGTATIDPGIRAITGTAIMDRDMAVTDTGGKEGTCF